MQVVLKSRLGTSRKNGVTVYALPGETVTVDDALGERLIARGLAKAGSRAPVAEPVQLEPEPEPEPELQPEPVPRKRGRGRPRATTFDDVTS